jgi:hydrogenase small subunit
MPFVDEPPGSKLSTATATWIGGLTRNLRGITEHTLDREPKWRRKGDRLATGYDKPW